LPQPAPCLSGRLAHRLATFGGGVGYEVLHRVGRGAMGVVDLAIGPDGRLVAMK